MCTYWGMVALFFFITLRIKMSTKDWATMAEEAEEQDPQVRMEVKEKVTFPPVTEDHRKRVQSLLRTFPRHASGRYKRVDGLDEALTTAESQQLWNLHGRPFDVQDTTVAVPKSYFTTPVNNKYHDQIWWKRK